MSAYRQSGREIGALVTEHRWTLSRSLIVIGGAMVVGPWFIFLLPMGENWTFMAYAGLFALLVVMPLVGLFTLFDAYRLHSNVVRLHADALVHRWKGTETITPYEEIESITSKVVQVVNQGVPGPIQHTHHLTLAKGEKLLITHGFEDVDVLIEALHARVDPMIRKRVTDALSKAERVHFGPLALHKGTLEFSPLKAPMVDVQLRALEAVEIRDGFVQIHKVRGDAWRNVPVHDVPNVHVFVSVVNDAIQRAR